MDEFQQEVAKQLVDETAGNVYSDLIQPTAKSIGNTLSLFPRTIGVWLGKWEKWIINGERSIELTKQAVQEKLARIPEEKLSEPEPNIAIPAIQQLSYCYDCEELRNMYANLLVSSMNIDTKSSAHPAFVDTIKQLTPDEAKFIKSLDYSYHFYPLVDIIAENDKNSFHYRLKNFTVRPIAELVYPDSISTYIENLARLSIIEIHEETFINNAHAYKEIENAEKISSLLKTNEEGYITKLKKKSYTVTDFGMSFISACVLDNPLEKAIHRIEDYEYDEIRTKLEKGI